jgi:hypothetical protein
MGVQNALMRTSLAGPVQTTVMTGNVAQLAIDLLSVATDRTEPPASRLRGQSMSFRKVFDGPKGRWQMKPGAPSSRNDLKEPSGTTPSRPHAHFPV